MILVSFSFPPSLVIALNSIYDFIPVLSISGLPSSFLSITVVVQRLLFIYKLSLIK